MPLLGIKLTDFRCFQAAEFEADPHYNLIYGPNASGKTSLLEAIAYLGRGKSFRGAVSQNLVRHGASEFVLFGKVDRGARTSSVGVRNGRLGLETRIDGAEAGGAAALAEALPLLVVDPDVHGLVGGPPEERRRYLDWVAFHVEHGYLVAWRRFRRALKQRNAALKAGADPGEVAGWSREFVESGIEVDRVRRGLVAIAEGVFAETAQALLGCDAALEYRQGWNADLDLEEAVVGSEARDREHGNTQVGPHRADLKLVVNERQARKVVSRGQQKLLACALVLSAAELVQTEQERPLLLLLDDPAAELDADSLSRLMSRVIGLGCQIVATALTPDGRLFPESPRTFHVEHGILGPAE